MERQSTSKLYRALIAVVAFFVLCTSAILFASCGTDPRECKHEHLDDSDVVAYELATCSEPGTVTYKCTDCGAEVTKIGTLATGEHDFDANGKCKVCGLNSANDGVTLKEIKDLLVNVATKDLLSTVATQEDLDELRGSIVSALKEKNFTIPALDEKLEAILESVQGLGDLEIEGFDPSDFEGILAGTIAESDKVTLADVITALYNQVHRLYVDYSSTSADSLYNLLVGKDAEGAAHVHNWVLKVKGGTVQDCSKGVTYEWGCAFCDETKEGEDVTVKAIGHATDYKYGLKEGTLEPTDEAVKDGHYYAATCISPARVEGHCAVCGQWTGEWNPVGEPTYKHNYVLEENHSVGSKCTYVGQNVYHCATCGGAYVEQVPAPGHNYYYELDENGNKVALTPETKEQYLRDYFGKDQDLSLLTEEQKAEALQPYLNVVYSADATCVDPGLVVVECVECGVRYSYTTSDKPEGHSFVAHLQENNTCTDDGTAGYAYCTKCGYFFFYDGADTTDDVEASKDENGDGLITQKVGKYSRNYIRKDGKVIHYVSETLPVAVDPAGLDENGKDKDGKTPAPELIALYEVISSTLPAKGHTFIPVYTNTAKCVTSQSYVLVCKDCFELTTGKTIDEDTDNFVVAETDEDNKVIAYALKGLTDNNKTNLAVGSVVQQLTGKIFNAKATDDTVDPTDSTKTIVSDISEDWAEAVEGGHDALVKFFVDHQGYLVRDVNDDDHYTLGTGNEAKAKLTAELDALDDEELEALYINYNVFVQIDEDAQSTDGSTVYELKPFVDPVAGHKFTEKFVTVIGGCTMYERHVYFCTECGQKAGDPAVGTDGKVNNTTPHIINGAKTDDELADDPAYNDLKKEWEAVKATFETSSDVDAIYFWLAQKGYLNDVRDDISKAVDPEGNEMMDIIARTGIMMLGTSFYGSLQPVDQLDELFALYTGKNVLGEFTENYVYRKTDAMAAMNAAQESENGGGYVFDEMTGMPTLPTIELGHKFDVISYVGVGETCDAPANYVYVCSVCGKTADNASTNDVNEGSTFSEFSFQNGTDTAKVPGLKLMTKPNYVADGTALTNSVPNGMTATGQPYATSDFEKEWAATPEDRQFDWLLEKGYLNGVIDSVMLFGYETKDGHVAGELEKALEENEDGKTLQQLFAETKDGVTSGVYYQFYKVDVTETGTGANKEKVYTRTFVGDPEKIKAAAEAIALYGGYGTTSADLTKFYKQSGDGKLNETTNLSTDGKAANKTSQVAAVTIPESGHLWANGAGNLINVDPENGDPLCKDFASETLTKIFKDGYYAVWQEKDKDHATAGWVSSKEKYVVPTSGEAKVAWDAFVENADAYGIIAACKRGNSCPLHKADSEITENYAFGFYAATAHKTSYEKFATSGEGYPTNTVEAEKVYYNYNTYEAYRTETIAAKYLKGADVWATLESTEKSSTATDAAKKAATEKLNAAAQAAMDADLTNLATLQKYWNTLFVSSSWLDASEITDATAKETVSNARKLNYPTITLDSSVLTSGKVDYAKLHDLFDDAGVPDLWKPGKVANEYVSAWRPLSDVNLEVYTAEVEVTTGTSKETKTVTVGYKKAPSCWVDSRCKWYRISGNLCTEGSPKVSHVYPYVQDGNVLDNVEYWYGRSEKLANCQHKDLCMTCGQPIGGTKVGHNLIDVTTITDAHLKEAWIKVLNETRNGSSTGTDANSKLNKAIQDNIWFDATVKTIDESNYATAWGVYDGCFDTKHTEAFICSGELEVIYNNLHYQAEEGETAPDWNKDVTWDATANTGSYKIGAATGTVAHSYEKAGAVEGTDYKTRFFYASDFYANGVKVGGEGDEIMVDETTRQPVATGGVVAEREDILFSSILCDAGYTEKRYCVNKLDHSFEKTVDSKKVQCSKGAECGESMTVDTYTRHGHTLAPVQGYDKLNGVDKYVPKTSNSNAKVSQVCVYCGMHAFGVWANTTAANGEMYNIATWEEINNWNELAGNWNTEHPNEEPLWLAEVIKSEDVVTGNAVPQKPATGTHYGLEEANGLYMYNNGGDIQLYKSSKDGNNPVDHNVIGQGKDVTIVVGADKTVTFKAPIETGATDADKTLTVKGTLAIVGEGAGSVVDFSELKEVNVAGGQLILKNITVDFSGKTESGGAGSGANKTYIHPGSAGTITFQGAVVYSATPFVMNAHNGDGSSVGTKEYTKDSAVKIVIEDSQFFGKDDVALGIWKSSVTVEATNSLFAGDWSGAMIRSGTATFTNCWFGVNSSNEKKYSGNGADWQDGSNVKVKAGILIGNAMSDKQADQPSPTNVGFACYGTAKVTLTACTFKEYTTDTTALVAAWEQAQEGVVATDASVGDCTTVKAIEAYSSDYTETYLTIDAKTFQSAGTEISNNPGQRQKKDADGKPVTDADKKPVMESTFHYTVLTPTAAELGATPAKQAEAAGKLVESVLASGGDVTLPKITDDKGNLVAIDFTASATNPLTAAEGKSASVDLGGNVVNINTHQNGGNPNFVEGDLTIKNGTIDGTTTGKASDRRDFSVKGSLTLDNVTAKFTAAGGILPLGKTADDGKEVEGSGKIVIKNSHLIGAATTIGTNASASGDSATQHAEIVIEGSTILATERSGVALLVNDTAVTVKATDSTFYGKSTAVWIRADKSATFTDCHFISGGWVLPDTNQDWSDGTKMPRFAGAALVVGEGATTSYGDAKVEIYGDTTTVVRGWSDPENTFKLPSTVVYDADTGVISSASDVETGSALSGKFTVTSNRHKTEVIFGNKDIADKFTGKVHINKSGAPYDIEGLEVKKNVFYPVTDTTGAHISVKYIIKAAVPPTTEGGDDGVPAEYGNVNIIHKVTNVQEEGPAAVKDAIVSGGIVELPAPKDPKSPETVTLSDGTMKIPAGTSTEIVLNGNTVNISNGVAVAQEGSSLKITGGKLSGGVASQSVSLVNIEGSSAKVDLENVTLDATCNYGIGTVKGIENANITIKHSTIKAHIAWSLNGASKGSVVTVENSNFLGDTIGAYLAGDATTTIRNSFFYGSIAAVEVSGGNVTFDGCTFMSAGFYYSGNSGITFSDNGPAFPTCEIQDQVSSDSGLRASVVINSKLGYQKPVTVEFKGTTIWKSADTPENSSGWKYTVDDMLKTENDENNSLTKVTGADGKEYYYKARKGSDVTKVSVAVVEAGGQETKARVVIKTNTALDLKYKANVWLYTNMGDSSTAAAQDKATAYEGMQTLISISGDTIAEATQGD